MVDFKLRSGKSETLKQSSEQPKQFKRIGHQGAGNIAPGNTLASFDAALAAGVDMIEFDVYRSRKSKKLLIAHGPRTAKRTNTLTLEEGLKYLASRKFKAVEFAVDLKLPGYEHAIFAALTKFRLNKRSIICSQFPWSLTKIRELDQNIRLAWSIPGIGRLPAGGALWRLRRRLIKYASESVRKGSFNSVMAHWRIATPEFVEAIKSAGGDVYAWTVDEAARLNALTEIGVSGIVSNDPRLFATA